jgi:hypothetical protein
VEKHRVKPILLALVLCDTAIREVGTNKLSLIGTFSGVSANTFPCVHQTITVYVALTEGLGNVPCKLRLTSLTSGDTIFEIPGQINFVDRTSVPELVFQLNQVRFDAPGMYAIEFWAGDDVLGSRKINVQKVEVRPGQPPPP